MEMGKDPNKRLGGVMCLVPKECGLYPLMWSKGKACYYRLTWVFPKVMVPHVAIKGHNGPGNSNATHKDREYKPRGSDGVQMCLAAQGPQVAENVIDWEYNK